jgi:hypothetical protein
MSRSGLVLGVACALAAGGWLDAERDRAAAGNRLYDAGKYEEAVTVYGEGLSDHPASERLRFNLAAAQYKAGNVTDAATTLEKLVPGAGSASAGDAAIATLAREASALEGAAAYNLGNVRYRQGREIEERDPGGAVALYEASLGAYKRAMARDPEDQDPKYNHELVARRLAALKERLEEERLEKERERGAENTQPEEQQDGESQAEQGGQDRQGDQDQQDRRDQQDQQAEDGSAGEQQPDADAGAEPDDTDQAQTDSGAERSPAEEPAEPAGGDRAEPQDHAGAGRAGGEAGGEERSPDASAGDGSAAAAAGAAGDQGGMTAADARALIDTARSEEVGPADVQGHLALPAGIGEAQNEW